MIFRTKSSIESEQQLFARTWSSDCPVITLGVGSAMHVAASGGHHVLVQHFLSRGMNVNLQDDCGCSALHLAAQHGEPKLTTTY